MPGVIGGKGLTVRLFEPPDAPLLKEFTRRPGSQFFCFGGDAYRQGDGLPPEGAVALLATSETGNVVAHGRVVPVAAGQETADLTVAVLASHRHAPIVADLLRDLTAVARRRGFTRLTTCVPRERRTPFEEFSAAGLRTISWFNIGGVTEVVLGLD